MKTILFLLASVLNSLGLLGHYAPDVQLLGRWVMVIALAAVGLQGHWRAFVGAGTMPLVLGFATWIACKGLFDDSDYALYHSYMDNLRDPVYGVGYRYILHLEDEMGDKKVVKFMRTARELPEY